MRKAKTPPKRKPVPAGRRAAKRKAGKDPRAKIGKTAKAGSVGGKAASKTASKATLPITKAGKVVDSAKATGSSPGKAAKRLAPTSGAPTRLVAAAKEPARATAKPAAAATRPVAKAPAAAQRLGREPRDPKKAAAERSAERAAGGASSAPRPDGAGAVTTSTDKPAEATAPPSLPTPIASFTI